MADVDSTEVIDEDISAVLLNVTAELSQATDTTTTIAQDVIGLLLEKHANVNARDEEGASALHLAAGADCVAMVHCLLANKAVINSFDNSDASPLHCAAYAGGTKVLALMLQSGHEDAIVEVLDSADEEGFTPLHLAVFMGHTEVARLLLQAGAKCDKPDRTGAQPMHVACLRPLDEPPASIDSTQDGAVAAGATEEHIGSSLLTAALLIDYGADVNATDFCGSRPLHCAAMSGNTDVAQLLLDAGAQIDALDSDGRSASDVISQHGNDSYNHCQLLDMLATAMQNRSANLFSDKATPRHDAIRASSPSQLRFPLPTTPIASPQQKSPSTQKFNSVVVTTQKSIAGAATTLTFATDWKRPLSPTTPTSRSLDLSLSERTLDARSPALTSDDYITASSRTPPFLTCDDATYADLSDDDDDDNATFRTNVSDGIREMSSRRVDLLGTDDKTDDRTVDYR